MLAGKRRCRCRRVEPGRNIQPVDADVTLRYEIYDLSSPRHFLPLADFFGAMLRYSTAHQSRICAIANRV